MMFALIPQNVKAFTATGLTCAGFVALTATLGKKNPLGLPERLSRKLMHIGCGPLFTLCWPLYSLTSPWSPFLAASIPALAAMKFYGVGRGALPDFLGLVPAATRSKRPDELSRGPFYYGMVHAAITAFFWKTPAAILSVAMLCGGDGLAEVVGGSISSPKLPWNKDKSIAGSTACFVGGTLLGAIMLKHFSFNAISFPAIAFISLISSITESLPMPVEGGDNITVPLAAIVTSYLLHVA